LSTPRPTSKMEDHSLSAVCSCLFHIFAPTLYIGGLSSIHELRTRHAVVTGTHLPRNGTNNRTPNINAHKRKPKQQKDTRSP